MELCKGANAPVPTSLLAVVISWRTEHSVDAHALLLDESGKVRSDRDLVFYNAPRHISQAVTVDQAPAPGTARLSVSLPRTEAEVDRIAVTGSLDDGLFSRVSELRLTVYDADRPIIWFRIEDSESVPAMLFGEFYRRDGQWRFRAVGQGWASGMAGLVTEFGVDVEDDEPAQAEHVRRGPEASSGRPQQHNAQTRPGRTGSTTVPHVRSPHTGTPSTLTGPAGVRSSRSPAARTTEPPRAATSTAEPAVRHTGVTLRRPLQPRAPIEPPPPPNRDRADWHPDPDDPARLRWWDGEHWTPDTRQARPQHPRDCARCGHPRRRRIFGGYHSCAVCPGQVDEFLTHWHTRAWRVLTATGPRGADWEALWASLRYQWIEESAGYAVLRPLALDYVERRVAFAFADGRIEAEEYDDFEHAVTELQLSGPQIDELRWRMQRGRMLSRLRGGDLPTVRSPDLHLDPEERVYLDVGVTQVRQLAKGPRRTEGRLIVSNKKLRFVGTGSGVEMPWSRIVSVTVEYDTVVVAATSARGGATFAVEDPDHVAATLEGALRVAKRLTLTPGQRDTRSIPQEVKAEVWQRDGGKCVECGDSHYLEFDHIIPLSRGGATSATNLQILCRACNRAKGARI
ncbi:TerD family protein [Nocardia donostiensis]|uniref:HNH nuclease domain-containing protein n=1 Tax=Nocardia donostiensis TaxID=1538463 RepID=A0A1W0BL71_9NOCA|nr:TerD family protein [Nocardia donostiensis]ONM48626.1 hypothetical protein B0T46_11305 [Nocardia donostiensis]OQS16814.1 hypothetical protein B0T36_03980 [Nocardia donostiensis]OQS23280.1 hypothetical protein B0T44_03305 [Nocardia donostiensis]